MSRVMFGRYFAARPNGVLTLPAVDDPDLTIVLLGMEHEETERKWRRASIVIQCALRGRLARKKRASQIDIPPGAMTGMSAVQSIDNLELEVVPTLPERPPSSTPRVDVDTVTSSW